MKIIFTAILILMVFLAEKGSAQISEQLRWLNNEISLNGKYVDTLNNSYTFSKVIEVKCSKQEIYNTAKKWIALNFNSLQDIMQLDDFESGTIICKPMLDENINYIMRIDIKENKARIIFKDFIWSNAKLGGIEIKNNQSDENDFLFSMAYASKHSMNKRIPELIESFEKDLLETSDDW